jgi:hypothetical protein
MNKYADFDFSDYPLVHITMHPVSPTLAEQEVFLNEFAQIFDRPLTAMVIFNAKHQKLVSSEARIQTGNWVKKFEKQLKEKIRVMVFTECSMWVQVLLKAVFLVAKAPVPMHVVSTYKDALDLLEKDFDYKLTSNEKIR